MIAMPPNIQIPKLNEPRYESAYGDVWYWWRNTQYAVREQMRAGLLVLAAIVVVLVLLYATANRVYKSEATFVVDQSPFQFGVNQNDAEGSHILLQSIISSVSSFDMRDVIAQRLNVPPENVCIVGLGPKKLGLQHSDQVNIAVDSEKGSRVATIEATSSNPQFAASAANAMLDEMLSLNRLGGRMADVNQQIIALQAEISQYAQNVSTADANRAQLEEDVLGIDQHLKSGGSLETAPAFVQDESLVDMQKKRIDASSAYSAQTQVSVQGSQLRALAGAKENVDSQIDAYLHNKSIGVRSAYNGAVARVAMLKSDVKQQMLALADLQREKARLSNAVGDFKLRRDLGLFDSDDKASEAGVIVVLDRARAAWKPSSPLLPMYITAGLGLAFLLCPVVMLARHNLDRKIKYPQQIELAAGVPCLAVIAEPGNTLPSFKLGRDTVSGLAYLRNRLLRGDPMGYDNHIISFMDLGASHASTVSVAQLGWLLASAGRSTLLVDLDFKRPKLASLFATSKEHGLSEWVSSNAPLSSFIQKTEVPELGLLQPGSKLQDLDLQLSRRQLSNELQNLRSQWDYILVYAPSLLKNPHLLLAAPSNSPVIALTKFDESPLDDLNEAVALAESFHLRFAGVILHHFPLRKLKGNHFLFGLGPHRYLLGESA
jgi:capsular polysaccharide biosynthesis protein